MALIKGFTWKIILPACVKSKNTPCSISKIHVTKQLQVSLQRLSLSDVSNPGSPISPHELSSSLVGSNLHIFTLKELQMVTHNFSKSDYLGEGGFGKVYKGCIDKNLRPGLKAQPVAVKVLDLNGTQGHREWLAEVIFLGQLKHPHLVNLIGYCYEDEHRLLVYEYMALGNLDSKLFKNYSSTLPWLTRLKIALGAAQCLAFLHGEEKPVIYRDFKASNILLDSDYNAKLSDFGLATDGPQGEISHISNSVMGTEGYAAPEYINTGHLTTMCDVYSFGVVLLELLTGRQSVDKSRCKRERDLVGWARPILKDFNKFDQIIDSRLEGQYSTVGAKKLAALAHQCLSHNPKTRPTMTNVVKSLEPLLDLNDIPMGPFVYTVVPTDHDHGQKSCDQKKDEKMRDKLGDEKKEKKEEKARNWRKKRRRIRVVRSRNVYSDTDLYKALGTYLYSPHN